MTILLEQLNSDIKNYFSSKNLRKQGYKYISKTGMIFPFLVELSILIIVVLISIFTTNYILYLIGLSSIIAMAISIYNFIKNDNTNKIKLVNMFENLRYQDNETKKNYVSVLIKENEKRIKIALNSEGVYSNQIQQVANNLQDLTGFSIVNESQKGKYYFYQLDKYEPERFNFKSQRELINNMEKSKYIQKPVIPVDSETDINYRKTPHMLVAGTTGSGKTYFLIYLMNCFRHSFTTSEIIVIDPKNSDLATVGRDINPENVATNLNQTAKLLRETIEKMEIRYKYLNSKDKLNTDWYSHGFTPVHVFIDEIASLNATGDKKLKTEVNNYINKLTNMGRQAGVNLVISTQRPSAEAFDTAVRSQLGVKIALGNIDADGLRMVFGQTYDNIKPVLGKGIGYIKVDGEEYNVPHLIKTPSYNSDEVLDYLKLHSQYYYKKH